MSEKISKKNLSHHLTQSLQTFANNIIVFLFMAIALGVLDTLVFHGALTLNGISPTDNILSLASSPANKNLLIKLGFSTIALLMTSKAIVGPLISILVVVFSRSTLKGVALDFGKALNFAIKRYSTVFMPYLLAWLSIQFGMIIIIPGIWFMRQYAFVDAVATLEQEPHVLSRSKKLTASRKKSLFLLIIPYVLLGQVIQIADFIYSNNFALLAGINALYEAMLLVIMGTFYSLYHERVELIAQRRAERKTQA